MAAKLSEFDYSELWEYVVELRQCRGRSDREECALIIRRIADTLPKPERGVRLSIAAAAYAVGAADFESLLLEFGDLVVGGAGWSAAKVFAQEQRAMSAEHGRRGGRPRADEKRERVAMRYAELRRVRRSVGKRELYEDVASEMGVLWTYVRDAVSWANARNANQPISKVEKGGIPDT